MSIFEAREHLSAYLDGDLSGAELDRMEAAVAADAELRAEMEELRALIDDLGSLPEVEAPASLMAGVLAGVAGLEIPSLVEDLAAQSTELAAPVPMVEAAANTASLPANVIRMSWWLKAPAFTALAASVLVGVGIVWSSGTQAPPSPAAMRTVPSAESVPSPSGVVADASMDEPMDSGDAIVDAEFAPDPERRRAAEPTPAPMLAEPAPRVMDGGTGAGASHRPTRRSVPESAVGPDGVFEADWEGEAEEDLAVAALEEAPADPAPRSEAFAPERPAPAPVESAPADRAMSDRGASADDVTMDGEPLEDFLTPDADTALIADASEARSSAVIPDSDPLDEVTFTAVGVNGTLTVGSQAAAEGIATQLRSRGWEVSSGPVNAAAATLPLTVRAPEGDRNALMSALRAQGVLDLRRQPSVSEGRVGLKLQVSWSN